MAKSTALFRKKSNKIGTLSRQSVRPAHSSRVFTNKKRAASTVSSVSLSHLSHKRNDSQKASGLQTTPSVGNLDGDTGRRLNGKKLEDGKIKGKCVAVSYFIHDFTALLFSPLFPRHRNVIYFLLEVLAPAAMALIIFATFTSGVSWKQAQFNKQGANSRVLKFPEITMDETTTSFRALKTNARHQVLVYYTPVNDFTSTIMQYALDICGLQESNLVFRHGESSVGAVGVKNSRELYERSLFHRNSNDPNGQPVGVVFEYDLNEASSVTGIPYDIAYTISEFDEPIGKTDELHPFVPPPPDENWKSPYHTSGFLGLQYAIEESIIRFILEKQKEEEMEEIRNNTEANARSLIEEDDVLLSEEIDIDALSFLIAETLEEIREEKERREEFDLIGEPNPPLEAPRMEGFGRVLGLRNDNNSLAKVRIRPISTATELPRRLLRAFDYDNTETLEFRDLQAYVVTFSLVVGYSFMSFFIVRQMAEENWSGIKELLHINGLPYYMHWTMLFVHAIVFRTITSALILMTLKLDYGNGKIVEMTESDVLFVFIYIHQLSLTFMNYFIGSYIKSVRYCGLIAVSCCVLSFYLPETFSEMKLIGEVTDFIMGVIFPNWCLRHAMHCLLNHEANEKSVEWDNILEKEPICSNSLTVGEGMIRLAFIGPAYFFLASYVGLSDSSRFIPAAPKWHNLKDWMKKRRHTRANSKEMRSQDKDEDHENDFVKPQVYEDPHPDKECFVLIRNLYKNYGHHKVALDCLSMNIMHEEITVFLGHSGSGRTTLISILAGLLKPSNGHATINGYDVNANPEKARQFIGVCPQKLMSFNLLTVREHVHLCYKLRGYNNKDCNRHTASILTQLKLWNIRSTLPSNLTNDELRRLGIAMSLVDAPKVLLFDEPTRGMDAMGRREIWDIIVSMRHRHTIIVTTNYMDEAEHLADRLALLAHGRLVCYGSLDYLKRQYDTGYFLKLIPFTDKFLDANAITNFVRSLLGPQVQIKRHKRLKDVDTLELELPTKEKDHFADFCDELDKMKDALHIMKYSIRQVNLNDIFIKICSSVAADGYETDLYVRRDSAGDIKTVLTSEIPEIPEGSTKNVTRVHQFIALVKRAWTVGKVTKRTVILHFVVPIIVIWIVVYQAKLFVQTTGETPAMTLSTTRYGPDLRIFAQIIDDDPIVNYTQHIARVLSPYQVTVDRQERVITKLYEILNNEHGHLGYIKDRHMIAYEFGKKGREFQFLGYFATGSLHSAPIALNLMNNVILSAISEPERNVARNWRPYTVTARNGPMPRVQGSEFEKGCGITCILLALLMSLSLAFISHSCCVLPLAERENGMKHLILMCRVEPADYWISNYLIDIVVMLIVSLIIVLIFLSDLHQTFFAVEVIVSIWVICALYLLWSGLMYCYYMCSVIPQKFNGYNFLAVLHLVLGIIPLLWFKLFPPDSGFGIFCEYLLLLFLPPYTITSALFNFFSNSGQRNICRNIDSFIQWTCDPKRTVADDPNLWQQNLQAIDPNLAKCCRRICTYPSDIGDSDPNTTYCFQPPKVFDVHSESWGNPGLVMDACALFLQGFIFWGFLILAERHCLKRLLQHIVLKFLTTQNRKGSISLEKDDTEEGRKFRHIRHESMMVESIIKEGTWPDDVALVCQNLTKSLTTTMIIKDFNLEVKKGQCVAILGRGNSGKSSLVRMITGELMPTQGNVYMDDANLLLNRKDYLSRIGYCPQKGCTFRDFTGSQMLQLMGRLRGIPSSILTMHVNKWLSVMGLAEVANDKCKNYGGGMKRRLCAAMAFIGEPEIVVLDEPTTGVDPSARERLWCVIEHLTQSGFTIIFTTYSTDEAFALSDKVVVIAEGSVQCMGSPEEVKEKYARGHTITFKLRHDIMSSPAIMAMMEARVKEFKDHVNEIYRHIDLLDEHDELLMFFLRDARLPWAEVFRRGHYLATVHDDIIESYEVTEGGVDDIFVFLTNKYHELDKPRPSETPEPESKQRKSVVGKELEELKETGEAYKRGQF